jgi:hypothetical protein
MGCDSWRRIIFVDLRAYMGFEDVEDMDGQFDIFQSMYA